MSESHIALRTRLSREDVAGLIEALQESLEDGRVEIQKGGDSFCLDVPRVLDFEVEGGVEGGRAFFRMDLSWFTERPDVPDIAMPDPSPLRVRGRDTESADAPREDIPEE